MDTFLEQLRGGVFFNFVIVRRCAVQMSPQDGTPTALGFARGAPLPSVPDSSGTPNACCRRRRNRCLARTSQQNPSTHRTAVRVANGVSARECFGSTSRHWRVTGSCSEGMRSTPEMRIAFQRTQSWSSKAPKPLCWVVGSTLATVF